MHKTAISTRQVFFIATPLLVIIGHFTLCPVYIGLAGKDVWIGMVAAFILGFVIFAAMGKLNEKFYGDTLIEKMNTWFGPWFGRVIAVPLILYFFLLSVITLYAYATFITSAFSLMHPQWLITITYGLGIFYMVHKGIEVIARVCEWILFYNIITGIGVSLALMGKKDYSKLLPMLENGIKPVIPVILLILAVFGELIVMLMVNVKREEKKSISHTGVYMLLFFVNMMIFPSTSIAPVTLFGEEQAKRLTFPVESSVRLINLGFIERFDIYGMTIMTVSAFLRIALLHYATSLAAAQWLSLKDYKWLNWIIGAGVIVASLTFFDNYLQFLSFLKRYYFYGIISSAFIVILWLFISLAPKLRKKPSG